jgi:hypothetical protein
VVIANLTWKFYRTEIGIFFGPGLDLKCGQSYLLVPTLNNSIQLQCELQGQTNNSDLNLTMDSPVPDCPFLGSAASGRIPLAFNMSDRAHTQFALVPNVLYSGGGGGMWISSMNVSIPLVQNGNTTWILTSLSQGTDVNFVFEDAGCWHVQAVDSPFVHASGIPTWGPYSPSTNATACATPLS